MSTHHDRTASTDVGAAGRKPSTSAAADPTALLPRSWMRPAGRTVTGMPGRVVIHRPDALDAVCRRMLDRIDGGGATTAL